MALYLLAVYLLAEVQVASSGPRICPKEDVMLSNGLVVPRGTVIWPMAYAVHHHPDNWAEPDRFVHHAFPPLAPVPWHPLSTCRYRTPLRVFVHPLGRGMKYALPTVLGGKALLTMAIQHHARMRCVCLCVCVCVWRGVGGCVHMCLCMCGWVWVGVGVCACACACACLRLCVCVCACMCTRRCVCVSVCMGACRVLPCMRTSACARVHVPSRLHACLRGRVRRQTFEIDGSC